MNLTGKNIHVAHLSKVFIWFLPSGKKPVLIVKHFFNDLADLALLLVSKILYQRVFVRVCSFSETRKNIKNTYFLFFAVSVLTVTLLLLHHSSCRTMKSRPGPKGSPRLKIAALSLAADDANLSTREALIQAGYKPEEINRAKIQAASKQKNRIVNNIAAKRRKTNRLEYYINAKSRKEKCKDDEASPLEQSSVSSIVDIFSERVQSLTREGIGKQDTSTNTVAKAEPRKRKVIINKRSKTLASGSRRTPKQVNAFLSEQAKLEMTKKTAYEWAVRQVVENKKSAALASREATELFSLQVHADTVRKVVKRNDTTICRPGPKGYFSEEEIQTLEVAILSHLSLSQASCTKEKKSDDLVASIQALVTKAAQGRKLKDGRAFWRRMQGRLSSYISLDSESLIELRRQIWTTYGNLTTWFDGWEAFMVTKGFATRGEDGSVTFSQSQMRRIINLDETKLSLDGSDGGIGGRPANVIIIKNNCRTGTATNKTNVSSTLMCGSNAAGKLFQIFLDTLIVAFIFINTY